MPPYSYYRTTKLNRLNLKSEKQLKKLLLNLKASQLAKTYLNFNDRKKVKADRQ